MEALATEAEELASKPFVERFAAILEYRVESRVDSETRARQSAVAALQREVLELRQRLEEQARNHGRQRLEEQTLATAGRPGASDAQDDRQNAVAALQREVLEVRQRLEEQAHIHGRQRLEEQTPVTAGRPGASDADDRQSAVAALQREVGELRQRLEEQAHIHGRQRLEEQTPVTAGQPGACDAQDDPQSAVAALQRWSADDRMAFIQKDLAEARSRISALESRQLALEDERFKHMMFKDSQTCGANTMVEVPSGTDGGEKRVSCEEVVTEVQSDSSGTDSSSAAARDGGGAQSTQALRPISKTMIDRGASYTLGETVWECNLFAFHPCVGRRVSTFSMLALVSTVLFHSMFIAIVLQYMTNDRVSSVVLDDLLNFRASAAHAVEQADKLSRNSVLRQICSGDDKLHVAASQNRLYDDIQDFKDGGPILMVLSQLVWIMLVTKEIYACTTFGHAISSIPWTSATQIVVVESADLGEESSVFEAKVSEDVELQHLMTVARVKTLRRLRAWVAFGLLVVVRLALALILGYAGTVFLAVTVSMSELVLNAMALGFVLELGSMFYLLFVPKRLHTLVRNTEPLPVRPNPRLQRFGIEDIGYLVRFVLVLVALLAAELLLNTQHLWRLKQAEVILCGGNQDFVYARNAATGVAHVARTTGDFRGLDIVARAVLQAAAPPLEAGYGFDPGEDLLQLVRSNDYYKHRLYFLEGDSRVTHTWEDASTSDPNFDLVLTMSVQDAQQASASTVCSDMATGVSAQASAELLRIWTGLATASNCSDRGVFEACLDPALHKIRAMCPAACACADEAPMYFFQHAVYGCPRSCAKMRDATLKAIDNRQCADSAADPLRMVLKLYAETLVVHARLDNMFAEQVRHVIEEVRHFGMWAMTDEQAADLHYHVTATTEAFSTSILNWSFMPGMPHPRGLEGCDFFSSWEFLVLAGVDPCSVETGRSLRWHCPEACYCHRGMEECPHSCNISRNKG